MTPKFKKPRKAPRVKVKGQIRGQLRLVIEAALVDLGTTGALVEHTHMAHPGMIYSLTLWTPFGELTLQARVVRSVIVRSRQTATGERELIYHSGVEFLNPTPQELEMVEGLIRAFASGGSSPRKP